MGVMQHKEMWTTIADEATLESPLWGTALRSPGAREEEVVFSPLADETYALGLETIYEGYLLHYGQSRLFAPVDRDTAVLLGDYLYAHGLVRIAVVGDVAVVGDLSELISLCARVRAEHDPAAVVDGVAWAATAAALGRSNGVLEAARASLRDAGEHGPLERLARSIAGDAPTDRALGLHADRVL